MGAEQFLAVVLMIPAVDSDLREQKVENCYLAYCAILICILRISEHGWEILPQMAAGCALPPALLWPLFRMRAMGAGDIKLLSVLGLLMGPAAVLRCLVCTFLFGGVLSAGIILAEGMGRERLRYFAKYARDCFRTGSLPAYRKPGRRPEHLHMTVPVMMSVLLWAAGM